MIRPIEVCSMAPAKDDTRIEGAINPCEWLKLTDLGAAKCDNLVASLPRVCVDGR